MQDDLKPYPAYKDSGVAWLGQVPEQWNTGRLRRLAADRPFAIVDGPFGTQLKASEYMPSGVPLIRVKNLSYEGQFMSRGLVFISDQKWKELRRSATETGDVILAKTGATIGKTAVLPASVQKGLIASSCIKFSPDHRRMETIFTKYLMTSAGFQREIMLGSDGSTRDTINLGPFSDIRVPVPPMCEQAAIVRYLDHADRKVRRAIRARQRLIKLLTEQKQAIIQRAVTRGLDPNVRLKPSGVPWLGDVPEHWGVLRLKNGCHRIVGGSTPRSDKTEYWNGDVVWVTPIDVTRSRSLGTSARRITREGLGSCSATLVPAGSIIVTCRAPVGKVAIATTELCTNQGCKAIVLRSDVLTTTFAALLLQVLEPELQSLANGTTFSEIPLHKLACVPIPVPPVSEQLAIVHHIDGATTKLDKAIDAARREIDLLREYRTRLIADVVTGKLDVRDVAAHLPDEPEEQPEPLDEELVDDVPDLESEEEGNGEQTES